MRIIGHKFFGQESAIFMLDSAKKEVFALNSDRVSRIKKDNFDINPILEHYSDRLQDIEAISYSFSVFDGRDAVLETKGTSYYWLNWQRLLRKITRPKYRQDLKKNYSMGQKISVWARSLRTPAIFYYKALREYYWKKYIKNELPEDFHKPRVERHFLKTLKRFGIKPKEVLYFDHHTCHAASAYYSSPFAYERKALVFTFDEHGDTCFSKLFIFDGNSFEEVARSSCSKFELNGRILVTSIAGMYSNFTEAMDLVRSTDEGKVEALAAYGKPDPELLRALNAMIQYRDLEMVIDPEQYKKFSDTAYLKTWRKKVGDESFCATIQNWLEEVAVTYLKKAHQKYPIDALCLAGGATANVIMNFKIQEHTPFKHFFIVPPMGDEGSAMGAAFLTALEKGCSLEWVKSLEMPYFGPSFTRQEALDAIQAFGKTIVWEDLGEKWPEQAAKSVSENKVIAVFQGRMEFGPRALGNRSIIANAADPEARARINSAVKRRPWYQPFCPAVLEEEREKLFQNSFPHKHMATAFLMKKEFQEHLPSAIHVDGTARPQFVQERDNPGLFRLLKEVQRRVGYGVVINTSFNLHGRTIVHTPHDAIIDFADCNLDELYLEGYRVRKA